MVKLCKIFFPCKLNLLNKGYWSLHELHFCLNEGASLWRRWGRENNLKNKFTWLDFCTLDTSIILTTWLALLSVKASQRSSTFIMIAMPVVFRVNWDFKTVNMKILLKSWLWLCLVDFLSKGGSTTLRYVCFEAIPPSIQHLSNVCHMTGNVVLIRGCSDKWNVGAFPPPNLR